MWANAFIVNQVSDIRKGLADGITVIALVDDPEQFKYTTVYTLGVLLPPYESLSAKIDGEDQIAEQIYFEYLDRQMQITSQLLAALHMGKQLMFYVDPESSLQLGYASTFVKYFAMRFGIIIGDGIGMGFQINPAVDMNPNLEAFRLEQVYLNCEETSLPFEQFCLEYPNGVYPSDFVCQKIMAKTGYQMPTMDQAKVFCANMIAGVKQQYMNMNQSQNTQDKQQVPIAFKVSKT